MELEDEAGYYAVLVPGRKIPDYHFQVQLESGEKEFKDAYAYGGLLTEEDERAFYAAFTMKDTRSWVHIPQ